MMPFGPFVAILKGKTPFDSDGSKGGLSPRRDGGPTRYENVFPIERHAFVRRFRVFS